MVSIVLLATSCINLCLQMIKVLLFGLCYLMTPGVSQDIQCHV